MFLASFALNRRHLAGGAVLIAAFTAAKLPAQSAQQKITIVSGFHNAADTDPFAEKDLLEVTSAGVPIVGLPGSRAAVTVACRNKLFGDDTLLGFEIGLTGTDLDIVTTSSVHTTPNLFGPTTQYATQDRTVDLKLRFDEQKTVYDSEQATDTHHVKFVYVDVKNAYNSRKVLIGLSAKGSDIALQLNLREPKLYEVISQCEQLSKQRPIEETRKQEAAKSDVFEQGCRAAGGGKMTPPQILAFAEAEFTDEARRAKFSGDVPVSLQVDPQGRPTHIRVTRSVGMGLDEKAVEAVGKYRFKPAMQNCHAIASEMTVMVNFQSF